MITNRLTYDGDRLGGYVTVETGERRAVEVLLGISTDSPDQAGQNLRAAGDFAAMRAAAERQRRDRLATVTISGATPDRLVFLYSYLYRVFLYPSLCAEPAGRERPRTAPHTTRPWKNRPMTTPNRGWRPESPPPPTVLGQLSHGLAVAGAARPADHRAVDPGIRPALHRRRVDAALEWIAANAPVPVGWTSATAASL